MPYNDDAREPSGVFGKAIGTVALVGAMGGGGYLAGKSIMKGAKKLTKMGENLIDNMDGNVAAKVGKMLMSKDTKNAIHDQLGPDAINSLKRNIKNSPKIDNSEIKILNQPKQVIKNTLDDISKEHGGGIKDVNLENIAIKQRDLNTPKSINMKNNY